MGSHGDQLSGIGRWRVTVGLAALVLAAPAFAKDCPTGSFRAEAGPDTASMLEIGKDGHFTYFLAAGALDEQAQGDWTCTDGVIRLTTVPTPKPAEFKLAKVETGGEAPFKLLVTWPDGRGIAGVDFQLEFDSGEPIIGYTQDYGWTLDDPGDRRLRQIRISEAYHGTTSPTFPIPAGNGIIMTVVLEANDLGVADFRDMLVTQQDGRLILHWRGGEIPYARAQR